MGFTLLFAKVVGPLLLVRALSIVIDRKHFTAMVEGLDREVTTISFSFFPIALFMACAALAVTHTDTSSLAAIMIHIIAWGGLAKASALMLFPHLVVPKARMLVQSGFLNFVLFTCLAAGAYFTWFGYFAHTS